MTDSETKATSNVKYNAALFLTKSLMVIIYLACANRPPAFVFIRLIFALLYHTSL